jgi:hypothetical protein
VGAFNRLRRVALLTGDERNQTILRLRHLTGRWNEIQPLDDVRHVAERLLQSHPLRTADALPLAAALIWCGERPQGRAFIVGDGGLALAAEREGFQLVPTS